MPSSSALRKPTRADVRIYLLEHPIALVIALGATLSGFVTVALPDDAHESSLFEVLPFLAGEIWGAMLFLGGIFAFVGLIRLSPRLEVVGWNLIAATQAVNIYAILEIRGAEPAFVSGMGLYVAVGCLIRAGVLARRAGRR